MKETSKDPALFNHAFSLFLWLVWQTCSGATYSMDNWDSGSLNFKGAKQLKSQDISVWKREIRAWAQDFNNIDAHCLLSHFPTQAGNCRVGFLIVNVMLLEIMIGWNLAIKLEEKNTLVW